MKKNQTLAPLCQALLLAAALVGASGCVKNTVAPTVGAHVLSVTPGSLPADGGVVTISVRVETVAGTPLPGVPLTFSTTAGTLSATSTTTDDTGMATTKLTTTRGATVTARSDTDVKDVTFVLPTTFQFNSSVTTANASDTVTFTFTGKNNGLPLAGRLVIDFGDGQTADLGSIVAPATTTHKYGRPGSYTATAKLTPTTGAAVTANAARIEIAGFPFGDEIDPSLITWVGNENISNWGVTSTITSATFDGDGTVCITHTKQGSWPLVSIDDNPPNIEAQIGFVANIDGKWYGGGYDWMGQGRVCKFERPDAWGRDQIRVFPLDHTWPGPRSGDEVGLYMSTPASFRIPSRSVNERTNIVLVKWP